MLSKYIFVFSTFQLFGLILYTFLLPLSTLPLPISTLIFLRSWSSFFPCLLIYLVLRKYLFRQSARLPRQPFKHLREYHKDLYSRPLLLTAYVSPNGRLIDSYSIRYHKTMRNSTPLYLRTGLLLIAWRIVQMGYKSGFDRPSSFAPRQVKK